MKVNNIYNIVDDGIEFPLIGLKLNYDIYRKATYAGIVSMNEASQFNVDNNTLLCSVDDMCIIRRYTDVIDAELQKRNIKSLSSMLANGIWTNDCYFGDVFHICYRTFVESDNRNRCHNMLPLVRINEK